MATGSLRRRAQLLHARADLRLADVRGNVDTRLKKLADGQFDALVLAHAGLVRLGLEAAISQLFEPDAFLPAIGQGALGIETRADDRATLAAVAPLDDPATHREVVAERALLAALQGGCSAPIGARRARSPTALCVSTPWCSAPTAGSGWQLGNRPPTPTPRASAATWPKSFSGKAPPS